MNYLCQSGKYPQNHILNVINRRFRSRKQVSLAVWRRENLCWLTTKRPDSCVAVGLLSWQKAAHTILDWSFLPPLWVTWMRGNLISSCIFLLFQGEVMVVVQCFISTSAILLHLLLFLSPHMDPFSTSFLLHSAWKISLSKIFWPCIKLQDDRLFPFNILQIVYLFLFCWEIYFHSYL